MTVEFDKKDPNYYSGMESQKQIEDLSMAELITRHQEILLDVIPEVEDKFEDD